MFEKVLNANPLLRHRKPTEAELRVFLYKQRPRSAPLWTLNRAYRLFPCCVSPVTGVGDFASDLRYSTEVEISLLNFPIGFESIEQVPVEAMTADDIFPALLVA